MIASRELSSLTDSLCPPPTHPEIAYYDCARGFIPAQMNGALCA